MRLTALLAGLVLCRSFVLVMDCFDSGILVTIEVWYGFLFWRFCKV